MGLPAIFKLLSSAAQGASPGTADIPAGGQDTNTLNILSSMFGSPPPLGTADIPANTPIPQGGAPNGAKPEDTNPNLRLAKLQKDLETARHKYLDTEAKMAQFKPKTASPLQMILTLGIPAIMAAFGGKKGGELGGGMLQTGIPALQSGLDRQNQLVYGGLQEQAQAAGTEAGWAQSDVAEEENRQLKQLAEKDRIAREAETLNERRAATLSRNLTPKYAANTSPAQVQRLLQNAQASAKALSKIPGYENTRIPTDEEIKDEVGKQAKRVADDQAFKSAKTQTASALSWLTKAGSAVSNSDHTVAANYYAAAYNAMPDSDPNKKIVGQIRDWYMNNKTIRQQFNAAQIEAQDKKAFIAITQSNIALNEKRISDIAREVADGSMDADEGNAAIRALQADNDQSRINIATRQSESGPETEGAPPATNTATAQTGDGKTLDFRLTPGARKFLQGNGDPLTTNAGKVGVRSSRATIPAVKPKNPIEKKVADQEKLDAQKEYDRLRRYPATYGMTPAEYSKAKLASETADEDQKEFEAHMKANYEYQLASAKAIASGKEPPAPPEPPKPPSPQDSTDVALRFFRSINKAAPSHAIKTQGTPPRPERPTASEERRKDFESLLGKPKGGAVPTGSRAKIQAYAAEASRVVQNLLRSGKIDKAEANRRLAKIKAAANR